MAAIVAARRAGPAAGTLGCRVAADLVAQPSPPPDARRVLKPEDVNVAPGLLGLPLAPPARRAWAMGIDLLAIAMLSALLNIWLMAALTLLGVLQTRAARPGRPPMPRWAWAAVAALVLAGGVQAWVDLRAEPPVDKAARATARHDKLARAAARAGSAAASSVDPALEPALRIAELEDALERARRPKLKSWRDVLDDWLDYFGLSFGGWSIVYFSLLPAWWGGQTLGKRWLGLRIMELTGKPITAMLGLRRYGGYAAGTASGGLGFLQLLWDSNRQAVQDKIAHTIVVDLRAPPGPALPVS